MVVSKSTAVHVAAILLSHLDVKTVNRILDDLSNVPGNASYVNTITLIRASVLRQAPKSVSTPRP